jgi:ASC-1-like (ASCH) protein
MTYLYYIDGGEQDDENRQERRVRRKVKSDNIVFDLINLNVRQIDLRPLC